MLKQYFLTKKTKSKILDVYLQTNYSPFPQTLNLSDVFIYLAAIFVFLDFQKMREMHFRRISKHVTPLIQLYKKQRRKKIKTNPYASIFFFLLSKLLFEVRKGNKTCKSSIMFIISHKKTAYLFLTSLKFVFRFIQVVRHRYSRVFGNTTFGS